MYIYIYINYLLILLDHRYIYVLDFINDNNNWLDETPYTPGIINNKSRIQKNNIRI